MKLSVIQVGFNIASRLVKMRVPDEGSSEGFLVIHLDPEEALALADEIEARSPSTPLRLSDGVRWQEVELPAATRAKLIRDLRDCAHALRGN